MHIHRICEISQIVTNILDTPCIPCVKKFWYLYTLRILKSLKVLVKLKLWKIIQYTSTQAHSTASHFRITSPTGEWLHACAVRCLAAKLRHGRATGSRDIQNGRILSGQTYVCWKHCRSEFQPGTLLSRMKVKTDVTTINPVCIIIEWLLLRFFIVVVYELLGSEGVKLLP
jgi:hypothetical protein